MTIFKIAESCLQILNLKKKENQQEYKNHYKLWGEKEFCNN